MVCDRIVHISAMKPLAALLLLVNGSIAIMNANLLEDYLRWQRVRIVIIFHCLDQNGEILRLSQLSNFNVQIHFEDISKFDTARWNHTQVMKFNYNKVGAVMDLGCTDTANLFELVSAYEYFNASYYWLMFGNDSVMSAANLMEKQNLNIDAKVTLTVARDELGQIFDLYDVYSVSRSRGSQLNVTLMGSWSVKQGLDIIVHQTEYERRFDFRGIWLKAAVTALDQVHHTTLQEHLASDAKVDKYALHRFGYRMWWFVMQKHNFTMRFVRTPTWGLSNTDGRSNKGIIGLVATKQCDLAINCISYTKDRIGALDYTVTVGVSKMLFVFRHPRKSHVRNIFLQPFRISLWMGVLAIITFASAILFGNFYAEGSRYHSDKSVRDNRSLSFLAVCGILCQQGFAGKTIFSSTRITLISTLLFSILIYQFYSTYIVGYLLILPPKFMTTLKHLLDSNLKVIVEDLAYNIDYLNKTKDPVAIELYNRKILNGENNFLNVTEGIARVRKGGYAFQCDTAYAYPLVMETFTDQEICDLQETYLNPIRPLHMPLRKGSPFKEMFRITLRKTVETAVARYQQQRFFCNKPRCAKNELDTTAVDMDHVSTLFLGLYFSIVGSSGILLVELLHRFISKRRIVPVVASNKQ
ncbi:ionotropic receptor 75a-like [Topomyia yanbarensis]|uniref:ionotropic receptor 75a-like n=1 Tax=Topomyia yanbarensis TaxID=2498891 RepID=UPI00273CCEA7|nr:ionotropic receptor 75a-like [Topomyia yanbarensis]